MNISRRSMLIAATAAAALPTQARAAQPDYEWVDATYTTCLAAARYGDVGYNLHTADPEYLEGVRRGWFTVVGESAEYLPAHALIYRITPAGLLRGHMINLGNDAPLLEDPLRRALEESRRIATTDTAELFAALRGYAEADPGRAIGFSPDRYTGPLHDAGFIRPKVVMRSQSGRPMFTWKTTLNGGRSASQSLTQFRKLYALRKA